MVTAGEVSDFVFEIAPDPDWADENIFEFGHRDDPVSGIGVAWWITSDMLQQFIAEGVTLGLSHERTIYDLAEVYPWGTPSKSEDLRGNRKFDALCSENSIAIHRFHSNIDVADWGMPVALLAQLGWSDLPIDWSRGVPVIDHPPVTLAALVDEVKGALGLPFARYDGDPERVVERVALAWGGLCQWWNGACCAAPLGFDVVIGGDIIDGVVRLAREEGWAVIDAFHHATEMAAMKVLADKVQARFPDIPVHYVENSMPWAVA